MVLAGKSRAKDILEGIGAEDTPENQKWVRDLIRSEDFSTMVRKARNDMVSECLTFFRQSIFKYATALEEIALRGTEERNRLAALKDLMDRAGTASALKVSMSTPSEYNKMMAEMLREEPAKPKEGE